ncbi:MAG: ATP-binding protein [Candidatus Dormibacteria bacterium]
MPWTPPAAATSWATGAGSEDPRGWSGRAVPELDVAIASPIMAHKRSGNVTVGPAVSRELTIGRRGDLAGREPETRIALLGVPWVERDGEPVHFDTRKAVALLALLAVSGRPESRERLTGLLWPGSDPARARAAFRRTLSVSASALPGALRITRSMVALDLVAVTTDVDRFGELTKSAAPGDWDQAAALYRGDFLTGFQLRDSPEFDDWQAEVSERLRLGLGRVLERLVEARQAQGDFEAALEPAQRWLALDPLHEPAHQALLRIYAATGRWSAAVRQYRSCVQLLDQELGVPPLSETTSLYEAALAQRLEPPEPARATRAGAPLVIPMVGRAKELEALRGAWAEVGSSGVALGLVGEVGVGKTTLLGHFCDLVEGSRARLVRVRGHDGESGITYSLAVDILAACLAARPDLPRLLPGRVALEAARLLPELAPRSRSHPVPLDSAAALARLYGSVAETVAVTLSQGGRPAGVLAVDDLQFADPRSLDLLAYLLRRLGELPVTVVLAWTPSSEPVGFAGIRAALAELAAAGRQSVLELTPLDRQAVAQVAGAMGLAESERERLFDTTGGLPLLVREYAQLLLNQGANAIAGVPPTVRQLVAARLQAAGESVLQLLTAAATLAGDFDADLVRAVSGRGEGETAEGLDLAVRQGLLLERGPLGAGSAPTYDFAYEVLRRLTYERNTWARRRLLHKRAADALLRLRERDPAQVPPARLADHLELAGRESEAAQWWWRAAVRANSLYAHEEAHSYLGRALACGHPRLPVLLADAETLTFLGRYQEALAALRGASAVNQDPELGSQIEHKLAEIHHRLGEWELAQAHLQAALRLLGRGDPRRRARLGADLALLAYRQARPQEARRRARQALTQAGRLEDRLAAAQALNVLGVLAAQAGEGLQACELLKQSLDQARQAGDTPAQVAALNNRSRSLAQAGRAAEALAAAEEALRLGAELADRHRLAALHTNMADLLHAQGEHTRADHHLRESAQSFVLVDPEERLRPEVWTLVEW